MSEPACRFVYPDVIKSYFIENMPRLSIISHLDRKVQGPQRAAIWSATVSAGSGSFQTVPETYQWASIQKEQETT